jgi:hypothetical protein
VSDDTRFDDLRDLEGLPPDDPRVQALGPGARAYLRAREDFVAGGEPPAGARMHEAERRLGEALERELGVKLGGDLGASVAPAAGAGRARPAGGFLDALLGPRLRPAFALALVVIVAGGVWLATSGRRATEPSVMRGTEPVTPGVELTTVARTLDDGALPAGLTPGSHALWRVVAMRGADEVARSRTAAITIP